MKPTTVTFRRVKNLGRYETETAEVEAEIEDGETLAEAYVALKIEVLALLGIDESEPADLM